MCVTICYLITHISVTTVTEQSECDVGTVPRSESDIKYFPHYKSDISTCVMIIPSYISLTVAWHSFDAVNACPLVDTCT